MSSQVQRAAIQRDYSDGQDLTILRRGQIRELFISIRPLAGETTGETLRRLARTLAEHDALVIKQDVLGAIEVYPEAMEALRRAAGNIDWPITWMRGGSCGPGAIGGIQIHALAGVPVETVRTGSKIVGRMYEDEVARYCVFGDIRPVNLRVSRPEQAESAFRGLFDALAAAGMKISHLVRTWLYLDRILEWYGEFNQVRNRLFEESGIRNGLIPASTGIMGSNPSGSAMVMSAMAILPRQPSRHGRGTVSCSCVEEGSRSGATGNRLVVRPLPSPLQCPALDYGSSFSRAVEVVTPADRRVLVSGTASIAPDGRTVHVGDVDAQIALTMKVVNAILESRDMSWSDVTRAVAYTKRAQDAPAFARYRAEHGLLDLPVVVTESDVCRPDLLFEIELDALTLE